MKKLLLIPLIFLLSGCASTSTTNPNTTSSEFYVPISANCPADKSPPQVPGFNLKQDPSKNTMQNNIYGATMTFCLDTPVKSPKDE